MVRIASRTPGDQALTRLREKTVAEAAFFLGCARQGALTLALKVLY